MGRQDEVAVQINRDVNLKDYGFKVLQVDLQNITEDSTDFNRVLKIDLTKRKDIMNSLSLD